MQFLIVKIPHAGTAKQSDIQTGDNIQSMKQNLEIMNQFYKNIYSLFEESFTTKLLGNNYISLELLVENELIKFVVWVPQKYSDAIQQMIWAFYPWAVVDPIIQPRLLDAWKFAAWWDFILSKPSIYPLKTYDSFEADPIDSILSSCSRLSRDEKLSLQLLVTPVSENKYRSLSKKLEKIKTWKSRWFFSSIWRFLVVWNKKDWDEPHKESQLSGWKLSDVEKKLEEELFSVTLRAYAVSPDFQRPNKIIEDLSKTFAQYHYVWLNSLKFQMCSDLYEFTRYFVKRVFLSYRFSTRYWWIRTVPLLGIKELSSLYHFPHRRFNRSPRIKRQKFKIVPAPDIIPSDWILLWYNVYGWVKKEIRVKHTDRFRHFYTIWQTWTWKSTMMLTMAMQDMELWNGFCLIDPHGDLCEHLLDHLPKNRIDDLIYFDLSNTDYPIWFNVFEAETEDERDIITNDIVEMFVNMYGHEIFWPRIQDYFRNASFLLMEQPDGGTMIEIMRLFTDEAFLETKLKHLKNPVISTWRNKTYRAMWDREKKEIIPFLQAKFWPFTTWVYVRNVIGQPKSAFTFGQVMQDKKILLCNLSKGLTWEINSQLIGRLFAIQIKLAALKRASMRESERTPYFLYVDEFQNYVSKSFESILSEARKYRLWLNIAHQYIDQLKASGLGWNIDLSKPIFWNVGSMLVLKVGPEDAEFLEKNFEPEFSKSDLVNMDKFKWVMRLSVDTQPSKPFSLECLNPYANDPVNSEEKKDIIKQIAALKYGTKRDLAEKEIFYRVGV